MRVCRMRLFWEGGRRRDHPAREIMCQSKGRVSSFDLQKERERMKRGKWKEAVLCSLTHSPAAAVAATAAVAAAAAAAVVVVVEAASLLLQTTAAAAAAGASGAEVNRGHPQWPHQWRSVACNAFSLRSNFLSKMHLIEHFLLSSRTSFPFSAASSSRCPLLFPLSCSSPA